MQVPQHQLIQQQALMASVSQQHLAMGHQQQPAAAAGLMTTPPTVAGTVPVVMVQGGGQAQGGMYPQVPMVMPQPQGETQCPLLALPSTSLPPLSSPSSPSVPGQGQSRYIQQSPN